MSIIDRLIESIEQAGYEVSTKQHIVIEGLIVEEGYTIQAKEVATGQTWIVQGVNFDEAVYELAVKIGFDLEG